MTMLRTLLVVPVLALALASCGDSGSTGVATADQPSASAAPATTAPPAATGFSECMAGYGLEVNDPKPGEGLGIDPKVAQNPGFDAAMQACKKYLTGGERTASSDPADLAKYKAFAECVRANGLPDFPDPKPGGDGGLFGEGFDRNSPAFQNAAKKCNHHLSGAAG
ncbi:hypothetical protein [Kribbella italica]|uniref:Uncharacterized protein n=1 Tax=Kribbella italica TaxID=1540520 RepID=A0A7W9JD76_9ACTN|nr:hypothetical protein [Kribbella italica]MBB5839844.1 hypothetical protein [Kribbella italica]